MLLQENVLSGEMTCPLVDLTFLQTIETEKCISVELVQVCGEALYAIFYIHTKILLAFGFIGQRPFVIIIIQFSGQKS